MPKSPSRCEFAAHQDQRIAAEFGCRGQQMTGYHGGLIIAAMPLRWREMAHTDMAVLRVAPVHEVTSPEASHRDGRVADRWCRRRGR